MFKRQRSSHLFVLQSHRSFGRALNRQAKEDVEYAVSNHPFDGSLSNLGHIGSVISSTRLKYASFILIFLFLIFVGRSAHLQIIQGTHFRTLAEANRFHVTRVLPQRGLIFDRNGLILAKNIPSFVMTMTIADIPKEPEQKRILFERASLLAGIQPTDLDLLLTEFAKTPTEPIPVTKHLPYERAMHLAIETKNLPGFDLQMSSLRQYPMRIFSLSHLLGYMGMITREELEDVSDQGYRPIDSLGKSGVEKSAESILRGTTGEMIVEVDARGRELSVISKTDPMPGKNISLTIDAEFQAFIESRLQNLFLATRTSKASVVALNPKNGEVYALVSLPAYDNNDFAKGMDQETFQTFIENSDKPLFARAISGEFPSGSTFKPFVAYAALAEGIISEHTSFVSSGGLRIGEWFFPDWKTGGHGVTDVTKAIAESVNTFFYIIGGGFDGFNGLGVKLISDYATRFGFGSQTGIDLPGEADGFLPSKEWKEAVKGERWYVGDTYHLAIGQGDFLTTPLQMAHATGIIANNGIKVVPHVIQSEISAPSARMNGLNESALLLIKRAMRETVLRGSARSLQALPFSVAGKTGTAQASGSQKFHSWFTGFAPYEDPDITLSVIVEEGGESTETAVPLAREILSWWFTNGRSGHANLPP